MKIFLRILFGALRNPVNFGKDLVVRSRAIIFQRCTKIHRLLWERVNFYSFLLQKVICTEGIELKNEHIVEYTCAILYAKF